MAAIEVANLTKRFGPVSAVHNLSFSIEPGTVVGFLGPNGAGKTTTLRILLGLVEPTAGTATFAGRRYRELSDPLRHVGAVLDGSNAHPGRTARNHLRLQAAAAGVPPTGVDEVLERVDLTPAADRHTRGFSLGMRQRLGLATALLAEPEILHPRRAGQRSRPRGRPLAPRPDPPVRGGRPYRTRFEPHPR